MRTNATPELPCRRCGGDLYLTATVPHPSLPGSRGLALCPICEAHDPAAQSLLAWFAIHSTVTPEGLQEVATLVERWVAATQATSTGISKEQAAADVAAWRHGEFDEFS